MDVCFYVEGKFKSKGVLNFDASNTSVGPLGFGLCIGFSNEPANLRISHLCDFLGEFFFRFPFIDKTVAIFQAGFYASHGTKKEKLAAFGSIGQ
jgi:hypothetical protein